MRAMLERAAPQIEAALPTYMSVERFTRITMTSIQMTPKLLDCTQISLISAIMQCAQLGLEPDNMLRHCHLVPFRDNKANESRVQIIIGYRGIMKLARNSDEVSAIEARTVLEKDRFVYRYGLDAQRALEHVPSADMDPGMIRCAYAICRFRGGGEVFEVALPRHIEKAKKSSRTAHRSDSPWKLHEEEMWRKTAIRRLEPFLPLDGLARRAFAIDEAGERGAQQYADLDLPTDEDASEMESLITQLENAEE